MEREELRKRLREKRRAKRGGNPPPVDNVQRMEEVALQLAGDDAQTLSMITEMFRGTPSQVRKKATQALRDTPPVDPPPHDSDEEAPPPGT